MNEYRRKIVYLYEENQGKQGRNTGFVKLEGKGDLVRISIRMKISNHFEEEYYSIYLYRDDQKVCIGKIYPYKEAIHFRTFINGGNIENSHLTLQEIQGIVIETKTGKVCYRCYLKEHKVPVQQHEPVEHKDEKTESELQEPKAAERKEEPRLQETEPQETESQETDPQDKWEMLVVKNDLHTYENDGVKYVKIGPENLNALPHEYQLLRKNSFLLHGFYRYRYLIIGKADQESAIPSEAQYIIGVPGTNQRNEKMMADMFGFSHYLKTPKEDVEGYWCQKITL